jgi:Extensin-like protein C-terminus
MRMLRAYLVGAFAFGSLALLAGCGHYLFAEREHWRHEAEVECFNAGAVKEGAGKVRINAIEGPGVCGIDLPLKVSSLGGENVPLSYSDDPRPPGSIPNGSPNSSTPPWPIAPPRPVGSAVTRDDLPPPSGAGGSRAPYGQPMPLDPAPQDYSQAPYDRPITQSIRPLPRPSAPNPTITFGPVVHASPPGPVAIAPAATLACPLVAALDAWIDEAVQPAALKWIGQPVVEIKQISAYSCRGMNGDPNATISEHAFGNALDIAAFTFADGRKLDVEHGWHGTPEEQTFLHQVQASACNQFTTVLAPGYNIYHYNHIHVDLMRRQSGRHACQPQPMSGDEVAARLGAHVAARSVAPSATGSITTQRVSMPAPRSHPIAYTEHKDRLPIAVPGADGEN